VLGGVREPALMPAFDISIWSTVLPETLIERGRVQFVRPTRSRLQVQLVERFRNVAGSSGQELTWAATIQLSPKQSWPNRSKALFALH